MNIYREETQLHNVKQYLCLMPSPPHLMAIPSKWFVLGKLVAVEVTDHHISTANRLPSTKKIKDRLIVKFVHRDIKAAF